MTGTAVRTSLTTGTGRGIARAAGEGPPAAAPGTAGTPCLSDRNGASAAPLTAAASVQERTRRGADGSPSR